MRITSNYTRFICLSIWIFLIGAFRLPARAALQCTSLEVSRSQNSLSPGEQTVTLTLSAKGIKVIDARGIESVVAEILARGEKI